MNAPLQSLNGTHLLLSKPNHSGWSSRLTFILAAAGSAVGLGNVWKFPYIAGEHGGGAFVLVYLACVALIGLPILMAEIVIGRRGGGSPMHSFHSLAAREGHSQNWQLIAWLGVGGCFLLLSFYSVVAGWSLSYLWYAIDGRFAGANFAGGEDTTQIMGEQFASLLANPEALIVCHSLVMAATMFIAAYGIRGGLERAARWMVPGLFVLLVVLVVYAAASTGKFVNAVAFLLRPNFSALSGEAVLVALGHAFFTLSVGMTAMMAYGAHLQQRVSIAKASVAIAGLDTLVAMLAGLAIFPIVFANGLETGSGPGLIFVTLPIAFAQMPGGGMVAIVFFLFLSLAALTSTISILEPVVQHFERRSGWNRRRATLLAGFAIWLLGIGAALAFNLWSDFTIMGRNLFDFMDFATSNVLLPLGGLLIAVYAGRVLSRSSLSDELGAGQSILFLLWHFVLRYVSPVGVGLVLVYNLV
ncbi:MAG: sodium-dependent transporter [Pseudomonadales bacterium]